MICHCAIAVNSFEAKGSILREVGKGVEAPSVRLLDASGVAANVGLLQVRLKSLSLRRRRHLRLIGFLRGIVCTMELEGRAGRIRRYRV